MYIVEVDSKHLKYTYVRYDTIHRTVLSIFHRYI